MICPRFVLADGLNGSAGFNSSGLTAGVTHSNSCWSRVCRWLCGKRSRCCRRKQAAEYNGVELVGVCSKIVADGEGACKQQGDGVELVRVCSIIAADDEGACKVQRDGVELVGVSCKRSRYI